MKKVKWTTTILLKTLAFVMLTMVFSCDDDDDADYGSTDELTPYEALVYRKGEMNCYV